MRSQLLLRRRPFAPPCAGGPQQPLDADKAVPVPFGEQQQQQQERQTTTFAEIERIRRVKKVGIGLSAAAVAGSAALLHPPGLLAGVEAAATASAALAAATGLALAAAKLALGDRLHVEAEGARLFVEVVPDFAAPPSTSSSSSDPSSSSLRPDGRLFLVVRDAGDGRGLGVYVAERSRTGAAAEEDEERGGSTPATPPFFLPRGAFLGCYEGDPLSERAFWERYPRGVGDYCIGCGGGFCLDGGPLAKRLREEEEENNRGGVRYSPCLINHSSRRANVSRITRRAERKVELYASRDLFPGEELLLDYGRRYWQGREAEEMD